MNSDEYINIYKRNNECDDDSFLQEMMAMQWWGMQDDVLINMSEPVLLTIYRCSIKWIITMKYMTEYRSIP